MAKVNRNLIPLEGGLRVQTVEYDGRYWTIAEFECDCSIWPCATRGEGSPGFCGYCGGLLLPRL